MTVGDFLTYLRQLPRVQRMESGQDPDGRAAIKKQTPEELAAALASGEIDLPADMLAGRKPGGKAYTQQQKAEIEMQMKKQLGLGRQKIVREKM